MALPAQVQAALDAAEATLTEANAQNASAVLEEPTQPIESTEPEPDVSPPSEAPPEPPPPPPPPVNDGWEQRYKTLQGLFNKTVPELQHQVKELQGSLSEAIQRLNQQSTPKEPAAPVKVVDPKDVAEFGDDLTNMVSRVSEAVSSQRANALEAKLAATEAQLAKLTEQLTGTTQTVAATAEQTFFDKLAKIVPDWEKVNADPAFLAWVAESDPVYGVPRQEALNMAQKRLDANRAAAVFNAFTGPRQSAPKPDPLAQMVSPKGAASAVPTSTEKPMYTQAQVTKFYDDARRGAYSAAEAARITALIDAALSEGRIR